MGFRGEALASMASVANIQLHSWNKSDDIGTLLTKEFESEIKTSSKARERGTTVTISHLFKKIPVRFRFLKSPGSECNLINRFGPTVFTTLSSHIIFIEK